MAWEFDWSKRKTRKGARGYSQYVWGRNPSHKWTRCRDWGWVSAGTLAIAKIPWVPSERNISVAGPIAGRATVRGYVYRGPMSMTDEEIALADKFDLWYGAGKKQKFTHEHRLVAAKKYGAAIVGQVVRHLNGVKNDNRPENLVIGSHKENQMDHITARMEAMYWRERAETAEALLRQRGGSVEGLLSMAA